jgi:hypothetical protein
MRKGEFAAHVKAKTPYSRLAERDAPAVWRCVLYTTGEEEVGTPLTILLDKAIYEA